MCAHRVAHENRIGRPDVLEQCVEIAIECTGFAKFGVVGVSVTPEIQTNYAEVRRQPGGEVIPPVRIRAATVKQHECGRSGSVDPQCVEFDASERGRRESLGTRSP
jgi:hypothetical protein